MSGRRGHSGTSVGKYIGYTLVAVLTIAVVVGSGGWKTFSDALGFGRGVSDVSALKARDRSRPFDLSRQAQEGRQALSGVRNGVKVPSVPQGKPSVSVPHGLPQRLSRSLPQAAYSPVSYAQALQWAKAMPVEAPHPAGYDRERYFGTWQKSPRLCGTGTSRDYILKRDLTSPVMDSRCRVVSGVLNDPYTGTVNNFRRGVNTSGLVQIDHVVALQDAWASGASSWTQDRRVSYANDPDVLLASQGEANMAKGNGVDWKAAADPVWLPAYRPYRCDYMAKRVNIKHKYGLSMSKPEREQTVRLLESCPAR